MSHISAGLTALLIAAAPLLARAAEPTGTEVKTCVYAGRLLADPAGGAVLTDRTIVVADGKIETIRVGFVGEGCAASVDLRDSFVLPGLIDSHVHLLSGTPGGPLVTLERSPADKAFAGAAHALLDLEAGFTTVADLGGENRAIFGLRDAVARGDIPGPRIVASGSLITPHGGDSDIHNMSDEMTELFRPPTVCSGVEGCRKAVREQINRGADIIKITATGGVMADTQTGVGQQFMPDELQAIVEAAHSMGRRVTAHAHSTEGINAALKAGVDSIEHGTYLDDDSIALFKRSGAYLIPTLLAGDTVTHLAQDPHWRSATVRAKAAEVGPRMADMGARAHQAHLKVAFGTDTGVSPHGQNAREFVLMVSAGFTPLEAIQAATVNAADHLQLSNEIGSIAPGKSADIVAVRGDPLKDVAELTRVIYVMARGRVVKGMSRLTPPIDALETQAVAPVDR